MNAHAEYHSSSSSGYSKKIRYYFPPFQLSTFQKLLHSTNVLRLPLISSTCNSVHASFFRMIPYFSIFLPSLLLLLPLHFSNDLFVYAQPFTCFGLLPSDPGVCNFQGTCLSQDTCQCFPSYGGLDCSQPMCNGIRADELGLVCSGRGACMAPETCLCVDPNKYGGQFCEQVKCFGIFSGNSTVCSSHGSCVGSDLCQCREGYSGVKCEIPKCFGIEGNNPLACSGRGKCVEMDCVLVIQDFMDLSVKECHASVKFHTLK
ncbi:hypothetical protein C9374_008328 [Naegleria lovaniensis]|uniref:EGF-like domain-containing protein n=1 Tax=Naegleria lovaniensis TaxID=51637 RepID=A0AA88GJY9_NAELO|nr:uncharacterized protein C9374_008328 [Naegleria lovaniensis]KAG2378185.1 hypothetical protein C9374_008328 [Naegleria lovaniensis]